ncbi:MAG: GNAT family protein [Actinomycetes bacterium]
MESEHLKLEVLTSGRIPELFAALGTDPEIYRWLPFARPNSLDDFAPVLEGFIRDTDSGSRIAYAVILKSSSLAIGTTSFLDLNPTHNSLEIGSTFYAKEYWRSFVNTECKILMLSDAFEVRQVERVTLKTDSLNERSRKAILRLGATYEGTLRHHMLRPDGTWRDSAYFSILKSEWPAIEEHLANKLQSQLGIE